MAFPSHFHSKLLLDFRQMHQAHGLGAIAKTVSAFVGAGQFCRVG